MNNHPHGTQPAHDPYGSNHSHGDHLGYQESYSGARSDYAYSNPTPSSPPRRQHREGEGRDRAALVIHTIGDIAAGFLALWILLYMLDANQSNGFVEFVRGVAEWLAGWSQDIFTMDTEGLRVLLNYGLPGLVYLGVGHGIAAWVRRL
ncbi:hypothetical protein ABZ890_29290 [Streptomyces sp. NPDC046984]|uniref:hypothetical protein n=1 Tax=Streptomyces sp. NPDC046984 TaxID=3155138 RepID=UPI003406C964